MLNFKILQTPGVFGPHLMRQEYVCTGGPDSGPQWHWWGSAPVLPPLAPATVCVCRVMALEQLASRAPDAGAPQKWEEGAQVLHPSSAPDSVAAMQGGSECGGARWHPPRADSPPCLHRSWGPRLERSDGGQVGTELESFQKWLGERLCCDPEKGQHGREWGQCQPREPSRPDPELGARKDVSP